MAGYSSGNDREDHDDGVYYSDGGCSDKKDYGDYYTDDHIEQQDPNDNDNVDGEHCYEEHDGDEISYDHLEDLDNVGGSYKGTGGEHSYDEERDDNDERSHEGYYEGTDRNSYYYEEQDDKSDSKTYDDEYLGVEPEESHDEPEVHVGGYGAFHCPQQTMTRGIANNQDDGRGHSVPSYEWRSRIRISKRAVTNSETPSLPSLSATCSRRDRQGESASRTSTGTAQPSGSATGAGIGSIRLKRGFRTSGLARAAGPAAPTVTG